MNLTFDNIPGIINKSKTCFRTSYRPLMPSIYSYLNEAHLASLSNYVNNSRYLGPRRPTDHVPLYGRKQLLLWVPMAPRESNRHFWLL